MKTRCIYEIVLEIDRDEPEELFEPIDEALWERRYEFDLERGDTGPSYQRRYHTGNEGAVEDIFSVVQQVTQKWKPILTLAEVADAEVKEIGDRFMVYPYDGEELGPFETVDDVLECLAPLAEHRSQLRRRTNQPWMYA
jgi:hypothetical protein